MNNFPYYEDGLSRNRNRSYRNFMPQSRLMMNTSDSPSSRVSPSSRTHAIFVFEIKINKPAKEALAQIDEKGYMVPFEADERKARKDWHQLQHRNQDY